jgi:hypothetical protein
VAYAATAASRLNLPTKRMILRKLIVTPRRAHVSSMIKPRLPENDLLAKLEAVDVT